MKKAKATATRQELQAQERRRAQVRRGVWLGVLLAAAGGAGYCVIAERRFSTDLTTTSYPPAQHLNGPLTYKETPPMGGPHNALWQTCGVYSAPVHDEHAVHSLEHGAVWITYRPDLPAADVDKLKKLAGQDYMLLSPYPGLPTPVVASAWNNQMRMTGADDPRLVEFIKRYKNNAATTPEFGATCLGGTVATGQQDTLNKTGGGMVR